MIVTRNERYTDWVYQGVHMHEESATHGEGLLSGHIYYRYSHDFLKEGEEIQREKSFIHLSDGSEYELGTGLSSEKITVMYHGQTSDGSVHIEVRGNPSIGVGVQSIQRAVTIAYDDGKVPVLDTDQLQGIMTELHDSLSESMVATAETVKQELRNELNTIAIDVKQECASTTETAVNTLRTEMTATLDGVRAEVSTAVGAVDAKVGVLREYLDTHTIIGQGTIGQYTIPQGSFVNILYAPFNNSQWHNPLMYHNESTGTIKLMTGISTRNRMATFTWTGPLLVGEGYNNYIEMHVRNQNGDTLAMRHFYLFRSGGTPETLNRFQMSVDLFIKANDSAAILEDGVRIEFIRGGTNNVVLRSGGEFMYRITE